MINKTIIDSLSKELNAYRKDKSKKWKAIALQKAIGILKDYSETIKEGNDVAHLKGIGKGMITRIDEILATGTLADISTEDANIDVELLDRFKSITGVGNVRAEKWVKAGYTSIQDIIKARDAGEITTTHHIDVGLRYYGDFQHRIPRTEIDIIKKLFAKAVKKVNKKLTFEICGSYRRGLKDSGDVDVIFTDPNAKAESDIHENGYLQKIVAELKASGHIVDDLTTNGDKKYMGVINVDTSNKSNRNRRIDIRCFNIEEYYAAILYFTGSKNFNVLIRQKANSLGLSLNEYGLTNTKTGEVTTLTSEKELFDILNINYLPPTERDL